MRKIIILAALMVAPVAQGASGLYMGVSAGEARGDETLTSLNAQLAAAGANATARNLEANRSSYALFAGYSLNPRLGVEVAYVDLGDADVQFTGSAAGINAFIGSVQSVSAVTAEGVSLRLKADMPVVDGIDLYGRLGLFAWQAEYVLHGSGVKVVVDEDGTDWDWALGASYAFSKHWSGRFEWGQYEMDDAIGIASLGLIYRF